MGLLELFILAVGLSMDAFAVSICKGLALPKINLKSAGIVGLWFGAFQALMPLIGYLLGVNFREYIVSVDHWIAFILLALIGGNMIKEALTEDDEEEETEIRNLKRNAEEQCNISYSANSCSISPTGQVALSREKDSVMKDILGFKNNVFTCNRNKYRCISYGCNICIFKCKNSTSNIFYRYSDIYLFSNRRKNRKCIRS